MRTIVAGVALAVVLWVAGPASSEGSAVTAYRGATLIDGTGAAPLSDATILVQGDRFVAVGRDIDLPDDATVVDLNGTWVVPGLVDAHVHFMTSGRIYTRPGFFDLTHIVPYDEEIRWIQEHLDETLRAFLCAGVTSVVSLGGPSIELRARERAAEMPDAPTVFIGHGVVAHAPEFIAKRVIAPWDGELTIKPVTTEAQAVALVEEAVASGADLVKTSVDDRDSIVLRFLMRNWRSLEKTIIEEAAERGLRVTSHAHHLEYARGLVELGVASLQHIPADAPVDDAFVSLARERGVIVAPTLALNKRSLRELYSKAFELLPIERTCSIPGVIESWNEPVEALGESQDAYWQSRLDHATANTKTLFDGGVTLAVASDTGMMGVLPGPSMHLELRDMNRAGIPAADLIVAATLHSARIAGKEDQVGSIEPGKRADFLVLAKDPLEDIGHLQALERIVKNGRAFEQAALLPGR